MPFYEEYIIENILDRLKISPVDRLHNDQLGKPRGKRRAHGANNAAALCYCLPFPVLEFSSVQTLSFQTNYINRRCLYHWSTSLPCSPFFPTTVRIFSPYSLCHFQPVFPSPDLLPRATSAAVGLWLIPFFRQYLSMSPLPAKGQLLMSRSNCGQSFCVCPS